VWAAGVTGADPPPVRARILLAGEAGLTAGSRAAQAAVDVVSVDSSLAPVRDITREPAMSVGEVALAVDAGRELAAQAAADGVTVLVIVSTGAGGATPARAVAAALTGAAAATSDPAAARALALHADAITGPLGALRRLGTPAIGILCGVALGAGERGLGCVCDGLAATAAAAVAAGIEPGLRARLIAARPSRDPAHAALLDHLELATVLGEPLAKGAVAGAPGELGGTGAVVAALRVVAADAGS
jgi:nicotinate-nucleotide--dimethylbenzimidazole phosphoribosyltransferase